MNETTFIFLGALFSAIHAGAAFCSILVSFSSSMIRFDKGELSLASFDPFSMFSGILSLPGRFIWTTWMSGNVPDVLEWAVFLANSLLWGFGTVFILNCFIRLFRPKYKPLR